MGQAARPQAKSGPYARLPARPQRRPVQMRRLFLRPAPQSRRRVLPAKPPRRGQCRPAADGAAGGRSEGGWARQARPPPPRTACRPESLPNLGLPERPWRARAGAGAAARRRRRRRRALAAAAVSVLAHYVDALRGGGAQRHGPLKALPQVCRYAKSAGARRSPAKRAPSGAVWRNVQGGGKQA